LLAKADRSDFVRREHVELEPLLSDIFLRWSGIAARAWQLEIAPDASHVSGDADALREAVDALLENAVKYSEEHTPIVLRAYVDRHETVIEVEDAGCGVAPDAVERIFERFGRADEARTRELGGVGLGLAIVQAIAHAHGGRCTVESSGGGSTFALRLPAAESDEPAAEPLLAALAPA
jgi:signal transduction histidine kinase